MTLLTILSVFHAVTGAKKDKKIIFYMFQTGLNHVILSFCHVTRYGYTHSCKMLNLIGQK